jgi:hypothetical protein
MGGELGGVDLVGLNKTEKSGRRIGVHQSGGDRHITGPERLEVKSGRLTVDTDVGDVSPRPDQFGAEFKTGRYAYGLDGYIRSEATCEANVRNRRHHPYCC